MAPTSPEPCEVVFPPSLVGVPERPAANDNAREWRCHDCDVLLGVTREGALYTKYKEALWRIVGTCECPCRRCGARNVVTVGLGWALPTEDNESPGAPLPSQER